MKKTILIPFILFTTILFAQEKNPDSQKQQQEIVLLNQKIKQSTSCNQSATKGTGKSFYKSRKSGKTN